MNETINKITGSHANRLSTYLPNLAPGPYLSVRKTCLSLGMINGVRR